MKEAIELEGANNEPELTEPCLPSLRNCASPLVSFFFTVSLLYYDISLYFLRVEIYNFFLFIINIRKTIYFLKNPLNYTAKEE